MHEAGWDGGMATYLVAGVLRIVWGCAETRRGMVGLKGLGRKAVIVCGFDVQVQQADVVEFQRLGDGYG